MQVTTRVRESRFSSRTDSLPANLDLVVLARQFQNQFVEVRVRDATFPANHFPDLAFSVCLYVLTLCVLTVEEERNEDGKDLFSRMTEGLCQDHPLNPKTPTPNP